MEKYNDSILTKFNYDENGTPISVSMVETQAITKKSLVQLIQFPDEFQRVKVQDLDGNYLYETQNAYNIPKKHFYVNYANGIVYFNPLHIGESFKFTYAGRGVELISSSRIFHKYNEDGDEFVQTLTEIVDEFIEVSDGLQEEELIRQQNEMIRNQRFEEQMETIQQEILDKDSMFQSQLGRQEEEFQSALNGWDSEAERVNQELINSDSLRQKVLDEKLKEVEDRILGSENDFNKQLEVLEKRFDEKINDWDKEVENLPETLDQKINTVEKRLNVDFTKNPIFYKTLRGVRTSVMQQFVKLPDGTFLFSQTGAENAPEDGESFTITRLGVDGEIIDYMPVYLGGHGLFQAELKERGIIYIYFTSHDNRLIKAKYNPYSPLDLADEKTYEVLPSLIETGKRQLFAIDFEGDKILIITRVNGVYQDGRVYSFSKYLNGTQTTPDVVIDQVTPEGDTLQGLAIHKDKVYFTFGAYGGTFLLRVLDLKTLKVEDYRHPLLGYPHQMLDEGLGRQIVSDATPFASDGDHNKLPVEPEGLFVNNEGVFCGVCVGEIGSIRSNDVYVFTDVDNLSHLLSDTLAHGQQFKLTNGDGTAKTRANKQFLWLINEPGQYYFTAKELALFEDVPTQYKGVSGYWLNVSARALDGAVFQELIRNTSGTNIYRLGRQVSPNGTTAEWRPLTPERKTLFNGDTRQLTSITLTDSIENYEFLNVTVWGGGGRYTTELIRTEQILKDKKMFFHSINVGDSATSLGFYAYEMEVIVSDDLKTLTQTRKSQVLISNGGVNTRKEDAEIGIYDIQGIRGFNAL